MSLSLSNVFDPNFYRAQYSDLAGLNNAQAISHFQTYGLNEHRQFSPFINLSFYRASYSDLANFNDTQLLNHLENYGVAEGRIFSPFFDLKYYRVNNSDLASLNNEQLFIHLGNYGVAEGRIFSPFIDLKYYRANNSDLASLNNGQLFIHLENYGVAEGRIFSGLFDLKYYRANNSDLASLNNGQLFIHLENYGVAEGRIFSGLFDLKYYRANNSDLASLNNGQLFIHLENYGVAEGREFSRIFNFNYYKSHNADLTRLNNTQLLYHFELFGLHEGRESYLGYNYKTGKIQSGFRSTPSADLVYYGGKTIPNLEYVNLYLGGSQSWSLSDIQNIDNSLSQAISDPRLNSIISQYFPGQQVTSNFLGSRILDGYVPISQQSLETAITTLGNQGFFQSYNLSSTVFNFLLPEGATLTQGESYSLEGLGGFHGSVHFRGLDGKVNTAYYAIGVYSESYPYLGVTNGIDLFNQPWQNVVATAYHELNEARTDPDVGESNRTGNRNLLGWYSNKGGEVGDYPVTEAGQLGSTSYAFWYEPLVNGQGRVPIQLLYSNAVHGPEDPTTIKIT